MLRVMGYHLLSKLKSIGAVAALSLASCGPAADDAPPPEPTVRPVKVLLLSADEQVRSIKLPAIVGAADNSILTFQVPGLLQELEISEGQEVAQRDVLARLDQRDFQNELNSARARFDNAQAEFNRAQRLIEENAIARSVFDQRRSARDVARASLDSALKRLDDTIIRAPFAGVVADIHVESFENVGAQQPILTLQSAGDAEAIVQTPASLVVNIQQLEPIETYLELDAAPRVRLPASFLESASAADPTTQTFESRFAFTPPSDLLVLPGMTGLLTGRFKASSGTAEAGLLIPVPAVLSEAGRTYVWVVDQEGLTVSRRNIEVSSGVEDNVRVVNGLRAGEMIVIAGGAYLTEGAQIRLYNEPS
ncbi:MAG: efflux RND transporter periplasmic adaptor subunit [Pseudomonadota bacterium]